MRNSSTPTKSSDSSSSWSMTNYLQRIVDDAADISFCSPIPAAAPATPDNHDEFSVESLDEDDERFSLQDGSIKDGCSVHASFSADMSSSSLPPRRDLGVETMCDDGQRSATDRPEDDTIESMAFFQWAQSSVSMLSYVMEPLVSGDIFDTKYCGDYCDNGCADIGNDESIDMGNGINVTEDDNAMNDDTTLSEPSMTPLLENVETSLLENVSSVSFVVYCSETETVDTDYGNDIDSSEIATGRLGIDPIHITDGIIYKMYTVDDASGEETNKNGQWAKKSLSQMLIESNMFVPEKPLLPFDTLQFISDMNVSIDDHSLPSTTGQNHVELEPSTPQLQIDGAECPISDLSVVCANDRTPRAGNKGNNKNDETNDAEKQQSTVRNKEKLKRDKFRKRRGNGPVSDPHVVCAHDRTPDEEKKDNNKNDEANDAEEQQQSTVRNKEKLKRAKIRRRREIDGADCPILDPPIGCAQARTPAEEKKDNDKNNEINGAKKEQSTVLNKNEQLKRAKMRRRRERLRTES